jgi:hypothetical protein
MGGEGGLNEGMEQWEEGGLHECEDLPEETAHGDRRGSEDAEHRGL